MYPLNLCCYFRQRERERERGIHHSTFDMPLFESYEKDLVMIDLKEEKYKLLKKKDKETISKEQSGLPFHNGLGSFERIAFAFITLNTVECRVALQFHFRSPQL